MSGFTKLVPEIIQSSIWNEAAEIRCVWIAMLATKDESGYVRGDVRTIARMANVSIEAATAALELFQQPDPSSHTPDNEGRRIMPAPGGWIVLNHELYRGRDHRAEHAAYVREWRKRKDVNTCDSQVNHPSASASVSASGSSDGGCKGEGRSFKQWDEAELRQSINAENTDGILLPAEVDDMIAYWMEPSATGRTRLSMERTWDTRRRMQTALRVVFDKQRTIFANRNTREGRHATDNRECSEPVRPVPRL